MSFRFRIGIITASTLILGALLIGCERSAEDLEVWRTSNGGMENLSAWTISDEEPMNVRVRAFQIFLEESPASRIPTVLDRISDEHARLVIASEAVPTVLAMWNTQDIPTQDDVRAAGTDPRQVDSVAVKAKDAAYFLQPYITVELRKSLQEILTSWVSSDQNWRNQLGTTTLGQVLSRAGKSGQTSAMSWLEHTEAFTRVIQLLQEHGDNNVNFEIAQTLHDLAIKMPYADWSPELKRTIFELNEEPIVPLMHKIIEEADKESEHVHRAIEALAKTQGAAAVPFLSSLIANESGDIRWVAAHHLMHTRAERGFLTVAMALPIEPESYSSPSSDSFRIQATHFCTEFERKHSASPRLHGALEQALDSNRWPAQTLALVCAQQLKSKAVAEDIEQLRQNRQRISGWGRRLTIGQLASQVQSSL